MDTIARSVRTVLTPEAAALAACSISNGLRASTATIDPLRADGEMLARKLGAAGVDVQQKTYDGVTHECFGMGEVVDEAKAAQEMAIGALGKAFGN